MGTSDRGADALRAYHERTKHSYSSVRRGSGGLDWANEPAKFKTYRGLEPIALPTFPGTGVPAREAIARSASLRGDRALDLESLSALLFFAAGVHRVVQSRFAFRTYACAGALYPNEVYVASGDLSGLSAGVYHYHPLEHALRRLRDSDARGALAEAAGRGSLAEAPAVLAFTGIPWRTAWKYRTRGYRHLWWDAGMMLANLLAVAASRELRAEVVLGFADDEVDRTLGLDGVREFSLALVPLGEGSAASPVGPLPLLELGVEPLSPRELRDPEIEAAHRASSLASPEEVRTWRAATGERSAADEAGGVEEVPPLPDERLSSDPIEEVILRRGSTRRLARSPMPAGELASVLDRALAGFPADVPGGPLDAFVVANAVTGLQPGAYRYLGAGGFESRRRGESRAKAGYLCLEQQLGADAAAVVFLMAGHEAYLQTWGGRGYRAAQLQAAVAAGRMCLGAYAQCLGASGITFYDDEATEFFGASGRSPMLAVVLGPEGARRSIIRCREKRAFVS